VVYFKNNTALLVTRWLLIAREHFLADPARDVRTERYSNGYEGQCCGSQQDI
jgi:hypothetical protein